MNWKHRLRDLILAGGALTMGVGCPSDDSMMPNFCGNAALDVCCGSNADACNAARQQCESHGGHLYVPGNDASKFYCGSPPDFAAPSPTDAAADGPLDGGADGHGG